MIPQEKRGPVTRALTEAFGVPEFEDIAQITRGETNSLVYRIVVRGVPYLLKIITRSEDPSRHYSSMRAAAEAGISPRVRYTNVEEKISITDFVDARPLSRSEALDRMPALLRELHGLNPFDKAPFNTTCTFLLGKGPEVGGFLQKFRSLNLMPRDEMNEFFFRVDQIAAVYRTEPADLVASHNDLYKPDNILFDGQRLTLVDWEAAFLNDRYADLAVAVNQLVSTEDEERTFLQEYLQHSPDEQELARFYLVRQLSHLFYTMALLYAGGANDWSSDAPEFTDFHRRIWSGEVDVATKETKSTWGRVHWERFRQNVTGARYDEALRLVSAPHQVSTVSI